MTLKRLERSPNWDVADGDPDIRGWRVHDRTGGDLGRIEGLLFEDRTDRVVYAIVDAAGRNVLVPIGDLELDESGRRVTARGYDATRIAALGAYDEARFDDKAEADYYRGFVPDWKADAHPTYEARGFTEPHQRIRLLEERLRIGKRAQQVGEVVATKRPVTETVSETIDLRQDRIEVARHAVDEPARAGEAIGEVETIRVPLFAEEAVVEKRPVVKEEIEIGKRQETRTETIREEVRHEELAFAGTEPRIEETEEEARLRGQRIDRRDARPDIDVLPDTPRE
jgi:uncharacterized protein (TIGR02271 family)